jgi:hypothetical protein
MAAKQSSVVPGMVGRVYFGLGHPAMRDRLHCASPASREGDVATRSRREAAVGADTVRTWEWAIQ